MKSIHEVFGGATAAVGSDADSRGTKRDREAADMDAAPRVFEPIQMVKGCVLDIQDCPADVDYQGMRDALGEFGRVRFLKLNHDPKRTRRGNLKDGATAQGSNAEEKVVADTPEGSAAVPAEQESSTPAEATTTSTPAEGKEEPESKATAEAVAEEAAENADEEMAPADDAGEDQDRKITARCRFADPESAQKALEGFTEIEGAKVKVALLTGAEEQAFWDQINEKLKDNFDNPDKNKGKGKGKGKGKDKGKKGKGKGKKKGKDRD